MKSPRCSAVHGAVLTWVVAASAWAQAEGRVELELITEPGLPVNAPQRWLAALREASFDSIRIPAGTAGDQVEIRPLGAAGSGSYRVVGRLTERNTLMLPGGEFRFGDTAGVKSWVARLRQGDDDGGPDTPRPFGLTPDQLVAVHDALNAPVAFSTRGQPSYDVLKRIAAGVTLGFESDAQTRQTMMDADPVADELQGLSAGTALAAVLRPLGLVMAPKKLLSGAIKLEIADFRRLPESWPVGWPPRKPPREAAPQLLTFLNVEIDRTPLADALEAIRGRLDLPILFDHNSLARHRIDPTQVSVSLPAGRTYYQGAIDRLLNQAQLTSDLRMDEAETPFLWISTLRK